MVLASAFYSALSHPCHGARALSWLSLQRCLEEEYTGASQPSEATLEPTLAGEEPEQTPEEPACSLPHPQACPRRLGAAPETGLSSRTKGTEGGHATGAAGTSEAFLRLPKPQVNESDGLLDRVG